MRSELNSTSAQNVADWTTRDDAGYRLRTVPMHPTALPRTNSHDGGVAEGEE